MLKNYIIYIIPVYINNKKQIFKMVKYQFQILD